MKVTPEDAARLFGANFGLCEEGMAKLGAPLRVFSVQACRAGLSTAVEEYRQLHSGGCRVLSLGSACECFLCRIQKKVEAVA